MAKTEKVKTDVIAAQYADGKMLIFAQWQMNDTCIKSIRIVRSRLTVEPPKFTIERVLEDGHICGDGITPWTHMELFDIGVYRKNIKVEDASGDHDIPVLWVEPLDHKANVLMGGGGEIPIPLFTIGSGLKNKIGIAEAVGYSNVLSFDEALQDALKNLPPDLGGYPDQLRS